MKSLKFLLIATLGMLFFTSCTKESESLSQTIECETFSNSEIINLGKTHNEIAINAYSQIDIQSCGSCTDELTAVLTNICLDMGESESNCNEYLAMSKSLDEILRSLGYQVSNWNNHPFTEEVYSAMVAIENLLSTVNNHTELLIELSALEDLKLQVVGLTCTEVNQIRGMFEVARNSSFLWMPIDMGGLGMISFDDDTHLESEGEVHSRDDGKPIWESAVSADVASSATYFTVLGIGGAVGIVTPGSNLAILGTWGLSTAIGSAFGAATAYSDSDCP